MISVEHLSTLENLTLGPIKLQGMSRPDAERQSRELLRLVGLAEKAEIEAFCEKQILPRKTRHNVLLLVEEILQMYNPFLLATPLDITISVIDQEIFDRFPDFRRGLILS